MKEKKPSELMVSAVFNIIFLVAVNAYPLWGPYTQGVVLPSFVLVLWAINLSTLVQLAGSVSLLFYRPARFNAFVQLLGSLTSLLCAIVLFVVFPLDFGAIGIMWLNSVIRIVLIVGMCAAGLAAIVQTVQVCTPRLTYK
ncbi:MAG TPA: hypothetical protein VHE79_11195 [Spirochaetia bacterium]